MLIKLKSIHKNLFVFVSLLDEIVVVLVVTVVVLVLVLKVVSLEDMVVVVVA
jgi:hypothetical protein